MKMSSEAPLIGKPGNPDNHRIVVAAVGKEGQRGGLAAHLVFGVVQVREILNLGDWQEAQIGRAQGKP